MSNPSPTTQRDLKQPSGPSTTQHAPPQQQQQPQQAPQQSPHAHSHPHHQHQQPPPSQQQHQHPTPYSASPSQLTLSSNFPSASTLDNPYQPTAYAYAPNPHDPNAFAFHPPYRHPLQTHLPQHQLHQAPPHPQHPSPASGRKRRASDFEPPPPSATNFAYHPNVVAAGPPGDLDVGQHPGAPPSHQQQQQHAQQQSQPQQPIPPPAASSPVAKKGRTNTPWTPAEEQRLKALRDTGSSWSEIAKTFPNRTEGSVKKHWYKDMHYAEFAQDEVSSFSASLLQAIKEYENNKWKMIGQKVGKPAKACEQFAKEQGWKI